MKVLRLYAGPLAMARIARHALQGGDVRALAGAGAGPKDLIVTRWTVSFSAWPAFGSDNLLFS